MAVDIILNPVTTIDRLSLINDNFDRIEEAFENTLGRAGVTPNHMEADLDLDSNDLLNGGEASFTSLSVGGIDVNNIVGSEGPTGPQGPAGSDGNDGIDGADGDDGEGIPSGGAPGTFLTKAGVSDFDTQWSDGLTTLGITATFAELNTLDGVTASTVELNYTDGVTSAIQTQLDAKQSLDSDLTSWASVTRASGFDTFTATPSSVNLKALVTDETGSGSLVFATSPALLTPTGIVKGDVGLGNVDNTSDANKPVSTAEQTALNLKSNIASPTFTGTVTIPTPFTLGAVSVLPTGTELNFVDGVTSAIQTQLDAKQPLDAQLTDVAGLTPTDNGVVIGNGTNFVVESGATLKTSLGLTIGTDIQAYDADLASWAGVTRASGFDTFAATPSSANLASLITDEIGSSKVVFGNANASYSPTWTTTGTAPTLGNGTLSGTSVLLGGVRHFRIQLIIGSSTNVGTGDWRFTTPGTQVDALCANSIVLDLSTDIRYLGMAGSGSSTTLFVINAPNSSASGYLNGTVPGGAAWATGDLITIVGFYFE